MYFFVILLHKLNTGLQSVVYQNKYYINKHTDFQQSRHTDTFQNVLLGTQVMRVRIMVFNASINNSLAISWRSVLLIKETGESHRHAASY